MGAFANCSNLKSITLPESITTISEGLFYSSGLESIVIPKTVTHIERYAFIFSFNLTSVTLKRSSVMGITTLDREVFDNCPLLNKIYVPDVASAIAYISADNWSVYQSTISTMFVSSPGLSFTYLPLTNSYSVSLANATAQTIYIPTLYNGKFVTEIAGRDIHNVDWSKVNTTTKNVVFENNSTITTIGNGAFALYSALEYIELPHSVTTLGEAVFAYSESLEYVQLSNNITQLPFATFAICISLVDVYIPYGVTTIGEMAFGSCESLVYIDIPDTVTHIDARAFQYCYSLQSIYIPNSVTTIGDQAFAYCINLTNITIPNSVTSIGMQAFAETALNSITIPISVIYMGLSVFNWSMITIYIQAPTQPTTWHEGWNRITPTAGTRYSAVWGCNLSPCGTYITSIDKTTNTLPTLLWLPVSPPHRQGYNFNGWEDAYGTWYWCISDVPYNTTVYTLWAYTCSSPQHQTTINTPSQTVDRVTMAEFIGMLWERWDII
jgi:hypothetical protein